MKKQNILITGGLGYIGTELCKLYSGESRFKNITVIDRRFVSERVTQLRAWGINFVQASILDEEQIKQHVEAADIIIHLAGITDVAYVQTQSNEVQDKEIRDIGVIGTRNVMKCMQKSAKIIFPSTHVVYEGFKETKTYITEDVPPCPVLTYSKTKVESENDLINSDLNYIILRLGSVYGYSTDTMRIGIMPNLFSKISSQNGTIKLFSGGVQLKSLVPLIDVARCMKFMAERQYNREIYHLAKDSVSVKEVADICKKYNPSLNIVSTNDEIPNLGYTISNNKLLLTGFKFLYSLETSIKEMVEKWSERKINIDLEYINRGGKEYKDDRGIIRNYELTEPINLIGYIESKTGSVRANHYHPIQEQKCLLVSGSYISVIKDLSVPDSKIETRLINPGDIAIIKPNVAHAMIFLKDSVFLNLVCGEREHENYGITHTIPYTLVDEEMKNKLMACYKTECRCCGGTKFERVVSLGESPLANNLKDKASDQEEKYPLEMNYCVDCNNCQLSVAVPSSKMFDNYLYVSSTSSTFRKHFEDATDKYIQDYNLSANDLVVDIGSNDGIALIPFKNRGIKVLGVEPAANIAAQARQKGIDTINSYFSEITVSDILDRYGKASLVTASNVFAHADNLMGMARNAMKLLKRNGVFVIEVQYLLKTIQDLTFDNIYHEHFNYWTVTSLNNFFDQLNCSIVNVEKIDTHGGSIRVYIKNKVDILSSLDVSKKVQEYIALEWESGLTSVNVYKQFGKDIEKIRTNVRKNIDVLKTVYGTLVGYGSPAKATTSLNYFGIDKSDISYIIEDNKLKDKKIMPGTNIPIYSEAQESNIPAIIVLAWNFFDYIVEKNREKYPETVFYNIKDLFVDNIEIKLNEIAV